MKKLLIPLTVMIGFSSLAAQAQVTYRYEQPTAQTNVTITRTVTLPALPANVTRRTLPWETSFRGTLNEQQVYSFYAQQLQREGFVNTRTIARGARDAVRGDFQRRGLEVRLVVRETNNNAFRVTVEPL